VFVVTGTIDIAAHVLSRDSKTWSEFLPPSGGAWGATVLNRFYLDTLAKAVGEDVMQRFRSECPTGFVELNDKFETKKLSLQDYDSKPQVELPSDFTEVLDSVRVVLDPRMLLLGLLSECLHLSL
jgi:hypothetical protein